MAADNCRMVGRTHDNMWNEHPGEFAPNASRALVRTRTEQLIGGGSDELGIALRKSAHAMDSILSVCCHFTFVVTGIRLR